jgi:formylglycine-generating enzyme required for sulfatase activity
LSKAAGIPPETPRHEATTGGYFIDKTEVTNQEYKRFCEQTGHATPPHWQEGTYEIGQDQMPVSNVSLNDAEAYARWRKARLPTETEWEKAARGVDGRLFPWGNKWTDDKAHHLQRIDAGPVKVGSHPDGASPYGCVDMIGNVSEWTTSAYEAYATSEHELPDGLVGRAVVRGGAWGDPWLTKVPARCASRFPNKVKAFDRSMGFRCVVDVKAPPAGDAKVAQAD